MDGVRILIAEDQRIIARALRETLGKLGYTVVDAVSSGERAIEVAAALHPHLVLMDIVLTGDMDGIEAARQIRHGLDIPTVFITAYGEDEVVERAKVTDPFGYILKPFHDRELHATIQMALHRHALESKLKQVEQELRQAYGEMEKRVAERTAELEEANRRLHRLSVQIIDAQEAERSKISRELHDEMGQALTAITFNLEMSLATLPADLAPTIGDRLGEAHTLTQRTLEQVRTLALDLRPAMLDDLGLIPTLRSYVGRYTRRTGIEITLEARGMEARLGAEIETALYRIAQEALTNVARHAGAQKIHICFERTASAVTASIRDDGCGFDVERMTGPGSAPAGMGLLGIRERVHALGGCFTLQSRPDQGTVLFVELPPTRDPRPGQNHAVE